MAGSIEFIPILLNDTMSTLHSTSDIGCQDLRVRLQRLAGTVPVLLQQGRMRPAEMIQFNRGVEMLEALVAVAYDASRSSASPSKRRGALAASEVANALDRAVCTAASADGQSPALTEGAVSSILDSLSGLAMEMRHREEEATVPPLPGRRPRLLLTHCSTCARYMRRTAQRRTRRSNSSRRCYAA